MTSGVSGFGALWPFLVRLWVVTQAGHTLGLTTAPSSWEAHVISFLNAALQP